MVTLNNGRFTHPLCTITTGLTPGLSQSASAEPCRHPIPGASGPDSASEGQGERLVSHLTKALPESHFTL